MGIIFDLYARRCRTMDDEQLRSEIKLHLVALGHNVLTPESKYRTIALLNEGLTRESMTDNHNDFDVTLSILKHL